MTHTFKISLSKLHILYLERLETYFEMSRSRLGHATSRLHPCCDPKCSNSSAVAVQLIHGRSCSSLSQEISFVSIEITRLASAGVIIEGSWLAMHVRYDLCLSSDVVHSVLFTLSCSHVYILQCEFGKKTNEEDTLRVCENIDSQD